MMIVGTGSMKSPTTVKSSTIMIIAVTTLELDTEALQQHRAARTDSLTGLLNRRRLAEIMQREIRVAERSGNPLCLIYFDLDCFKDINDHHGHHVGDQALREVARVLRSAIRSSSRAMRATTCRSPLARLRC